MTKRFIALLCVIGSVIVFQACKEKFNMLAPYKDIPVVYGLMDQNDKTHYIRINKAYEGNGNAFTMAQQYDSVNYPVGTLTVQLQDFTQGTSVKLDTTSTILVVPGIFSYPKQFLYYTNSILNPNDQYNLIITNTHTGKVVTGSTSLLQDVTLQGIGVSPTLPLAWVSGLFSKISWSPIPNGAIYQLTLRFYYQEINTSNDTALKYVDWVFAPQSGADSASYSTSYNGPGFLQFMTTNIPPMNASIKKRVADTVDVMFSTGSNDFDTYLNLSQPSLTVNQDKPYFTDIQGGGIGIFTARHTQIYRKYLSNAALDSIETNPLTSGLGF